LIQTVNWLNQLLMGSDRCKLVRPVVDRFRPLNWFRPFANRFRPVNWGFNPMADGFKAMLLIGTVQLLIDSDGELV
jgi:hypothetical protein